MKKFISERMAIAASQSIKEKEYWSNKLSGELEKSYFPYDSRQEAPQQTITAEAGKDIVKFTLPPKLFPRLLALMNKSDSRLHMILIAGVVTLLEKYTGKKDIIIGIPVDKQDIEGEFINTLLALRNHLRYQITFKELLLQVRKTLFEAAENQNYPLEVLLYDLGMEDNEGECPLFDVVVLLQNLQDKSYIKSVRPNMVFSFLRTGDSIEGTVEYNTSKYEKQTIERITGHFISLMGKTLFNIDSPVSGFDILSPEERKKILYNFNRAKVDYPGDKRDKALHQIFEHQVEQSPDNIALIIEDEETTPKIMKLTYRRLNENANQLARKLQSKGFGKDCIAALLMENSMEMAAAILAVLKAGGAYLPLDPEHPEDRIKYILEDSHANGLMIQKHLYDTHNHLFSQLSFSLDTIFVLDNDMFSEQEYPGLNSNLNLAVEPAELAYVIYTSGTTGIPKGTLIKHKGIVNYTCWRIERYRYTNKDVTLQPLPYIFDGFGSNLYSGLLSGGALLMIPDPKKLNFEYIRGVIKFHRVTNVSLVPSMYRLFIEGANPGDLSSLRFVVLAGEKSGVNLIKLNREKAPQVLLINEYGPTEATITATSYSGIDGTSTNIIGTPIVNAFIYILDQSRQVVPLRVPGEIYIGGRGVARGYLNRPELTAEKFDHDLWDYHDEKLLREVQGGGFLEKNPPGRRRQKLYKTGDLGRWCPDGNIEFLGRIDQQVKIRGYRVELAEVENQLLKHHQIKEAVVLDRADDRGDRYLLGYVVPLKGQTLSVSQLREFLLKRIPPYMVPSAFVSLETVPLTSTGKPDRKKLLASKDTIISGAEFQAPTSDLERTLAVMWEEVLEIEKDTIGIDANFFESGGHSLKVTMLVSKIHKELDVKLALKDIFTYPTIRGLAQYIMRSRPEDRYSSIQAVEKKEYYPLSPAQRRLYILYRMGMVDIGYNSATIVVLEGPLDREKPEKTFKQLIQRHESLRTSFMMIDKQPAQRIHPTVSFKVLHTESTQQKAPGIIKGFIKVFDLEQAPLIRAMMIKIGPQKHILAMDMHHIISDGVSQAVLIQDFLLYYGNQPLPGLKLQYKDFSQWQNTVQQQESVKKQETYWLNQFAGEIPVLNLPTDYKRPMVQLFEGATLGFELEPEILERLNTLVVDRGVTLFMAVVSIFNIFLAKLSGLEDIPVGIPVAGRRHADLESIMGMFVNTLVPRNTPAGEKTYLQFLAEVKENILAAFENQDYPFEDLVERTEIRRDPGRNPLFDVVLAWQNMMAPKQVAEMQMSGLKVRPFPTESRISKFDITFHGIEQEDTVSFSIEYCTKLFKGKTIERFITYFHQVMETVLEEPGQKIKEIEIISREEKEQVLVDFNNTRTSYPADKTLHQLFEEQVERTPDSIAAAPTHRGIPLTYRQLNIRSNQLAQVLRDKGVRPDCAVGIMADRSPHMIIGILAIVKAGGAYLPIDSGYPAERIQYLLEDSQTPLLLISNHPASGRETDRLTIDLEDETIYRGDATNLDNINHTADLAYIIYTSGSTGEPKGVMVTHRNVVRLVKNTNYIQFKPGMRILQTGALEFDASTFEIWGALVNGLPLYLVPKKEILTSEALKNIIDQYGITTLWMTSPFFNQMAQSNIEIFAGLQHLLVGGDVLNPTYIYQVKQRFPSLEIINGYGPTENTTFSTTYRIQDLPRGSIPIGKPICNSTAYIVDQYDHLLPIGVVGELYVGGDGVSRGYSNNPELTAEKFILPQTYTEKNETQPLSNKKFLREGPGGAVFSKRVPPGRRRQYAYKTGDRVRWLSDGNIEFLGRADFQAKIRGFRIEPGEIEAQLLKHPQIKEAVVSVRQQGNDNRYLCAYIVTDVAIPVRELRDYLSGKLPEYMIPRYFVQLEEMPLTANGKIDRAILQEMDPGSSSGTEYVAPQTEVEKTIAHVWEEVLCEKNIGVHDNFFEVGGNSLKIIQLGDQLKQTLGKSFTVASLFRFPTISSFARYVEQGDTDEMISEEEINESIVKMDDAMAILTGGEADV